MKGTRTAPINQVLCTLLCGVFIKVNCRLIATMFAVYSKKLLRRASGRHYMLHNEYFLIFTFI